MNIDYDWLTYYDQSMIVEIVILFTMRREGRTLNQGIS